MKPRILLALGITVALISGATYFRHKGEVSGRDFIISEDYSYTDLAQDSLPSSTAALDDQQVDEESLTITDLVARQLFSDYFNLATNGSVTPESLEQLAKRYVDQLAELETARRKTLLDLKIVGNSQTEKKTYDKAVGDIYTLYQTRLMEIVVDSRGIEPTSPEFLVAATRISSLYEEASRELVRTPVPSVFAGTHLRLVNNYLSNITAFSAISSLSKDPLSSYAGLVVAMRNAKEEGELWSTLTKMIASSDIITRSP